MARSSGIVQVVFLSLGKVIRAIAQWFGFLFKKLGNFQNLD
ncbi:hypothetical protein [Nostoc mirabile]|nr:hypothetical protein [Nostoc mirabile]